MLYAISQNMFFVATVLVYLVLQVAAGPSYDESVGKTQIKLAAAAYCCGTLGNGCETWNCDVCKSLPYVNATVIADKKTNANGYVGYMNATNEIIISFSGTDPLSIKNWIDDLSAIMCPYPACNVAGVNCSVHEGFYHTYLSVQTQVQDAVQYWLKLHSTATITITGHSLGAALAVHAALDLYQTMSLLPTKLYTFGNPRVGNSNFAAYFNSSILPSEQFRVVHHKDPVPHLLIQDWGYKHSAREVFYTQNDKSYTVCDGSGEDPHCSDQYTLDLDVLNHLTYIDFNIATNYLECKL